MKERPSFPVKLRRPARNREGYLVGYEAVKGQDVPRGFVEKAVTIFEDGAVKQDFKQIKRRKFSH